MTRVDGSARSDVGSPTPAGDRQASAQLRLVIKLGETPAERLPRTGDDGCGHSSVMIYGAASTAASYWASHIPALAEQLPFLEQATAASMAVTSMAVIHQGARAVKRRVKRWWDDHMEVGPIRYSSDKIKKKK